MPRDEAGLFSGTNCKAGKIVSGIFVWITVISYIHKKVNSQSLRSCFKSEGFGCFILTNMIFENGLFGN